MIRLTVEAGKPFEVELVSASGGGYLWEAGPLPPGVRLLGARMIAPPGSAAGDAATQVFTLQVDLPGPLLPLRFVLKRRWEAQPIETREIELEVR